MNAKTVAMDHLIFNLPRSKRLDIERIIHSKTVLPILGITNILVKNIKQKDAEIIQALLPFLKVDCIQASMNNQV